MYALERIDVLEEYLDCIDEKLDEIRNKI